MTDSDPVMSERLEHLGQLVRARRLELGIREAKELAHRVGVSSRVITDLERGNRRVGPATYNALENELKWAPGSAFGILDYGRREPMPAAPRPRDQTGVATDALISELKARLRAVEARESALEERLDALEQRIQPEGIQSTTHVGTPTITGSWAARPGTSEGRRARADQDQAETGSQDHGSEDPA